ncbi:HU-CCDC81 and SPOR domain-containing protein [Veillonella sp. 3891]|uniref:SMODS-associated NUDIX domain-containing protein n=1 Tax=Veillonella sp. 3891 TaxID=2490951 RepID=UPI000F8EFFDC|nr:HU-CCDC81 and SPOR domain-containing protein [Veillonella sp. 3891]
MKFVKSVIMFIISLFLIATMVIFELKSWPAGSSIAGLFLGFSLQALFHLIQDILDTTDWKMSQRKLKRGGFITDNTIIRISFAYLYRIKIGDKYLLVKNERGTRKYQPVGGVYKFKEDEKIELKNRFQVKDDNKISIDESSRNDYRLRMENKYLRKFISHFDKKANRESVNNLSREFREELIEKDIINWNKISYRFCGRHMTSLHFGEHFQIYEILLADVVELLPTVEQTEDLKRLLNKPSDKYRLATAEEITSLGVNTSIGQLSEEIADHTRKILQENEGELIKTSGVGKIYTVDI